jgi:hypothetical protein
MKKTFLAVLSLTILLGGLAITAAAQENSEGPINTLSVNPRQNAELGNYTGTETGQPTTGMPRTENQPNGLVPSTTPMTGSGSTTDTQRVPPAGLNGLPLARSEANPNNNAAQTKQTRGGKPHTPSK